MNILIITDNKPGHYNQSYAILKAFEYLYPDDIKTDVIEAKLKIKFLRVILKYFLNNKFNYPNILKSFYTINKNIKQKPDIIISSGGDTSFLNAIYAQIFHAKNFFAGSLRRLDANLFSAVFSSDISLKNNIELNAPISVITHNEIDMEAKKFSKIHNLEKKEYWTFLIGGSDAGYEFKKSDIKNLISQIEKIQTNFPDIGLLISSSRRTDAMFEAELKKLKNIDYLVLYNEKPEKIVKAFLGLSRKIFVSEDSISMVAEAIASSKEVYTLLPQIARPNENDLNILTKHEKKELIQRVPIKDIENYIYNTFSYNKVSMEPFQEIAQKIRFY